MNDTEFRCDDVLERLPLHAGGDLESAERALVRAHLATCEPCNERAAAFERARGAFSAALPRWESRSDEPGLWAGVRERLQVEGLLDGAQPASARPARGRLLRFGRIGSLGAAAAAAVLLFFVAGEGFGLRTGSSSTPSAVVSPADGAEARPVAFGHSASGPAAGGGLRRVDAREQAFSESAETLVPVDEQVQTLPLTPVQRLGGTTLVRYR